VSTAAGKRLALLTQTLVLQGIGVAGSPETSARKPGLRAALVQELAVPRGTRGPALARQLSGSASAAIGGLAFFLLAVIASLTAVVLSRIPPRTVMLCGIAATVAAAAGFVQVAVGLKEHDVVPGCG
jgi:hypothetical protein